MCLDDRRICPPIAAEKAPYAIKCAECDNQVKEFSKKFQIDHFFLLIISVRPSAVSHQLVIYPNTVERVDLSDLDLLSLPVLSEMER